MPNILKQTTHLPSLMKELEVIFKPIIILSNLKGKLIYISYQTNKIYLYIQNSLGSC